MTKAKSPLLSLGAHGTIGKVVTFQRRYGTNFARMKPVPTDLKTLAQMYQRWDYQDYIAQWQELTDAEKLAYRKAGSKLRLPTFAYFMQIKLNTLPDLAGRWHLDESSGAIAYDSSKNTNHGIIYGTTPATGIIDSARYFDGLDDRISIPHTPTLNIAGDISISLFLRPQDFAAHRYICGNGRSGWYGYQLWLFNTGDIAFRTSQLGVNQVSRSEVLIVTAGRWYHIAVTRTGVTPHLYIDGEEATRFAEAHLDPAPSPENFAIGAYRNSGLFIKGDIDHLAVRTRVLTPSDVERQAERSYPL